MPENTCSKKSPIIAWKLHGYGIDREEVSRYFPQDENRFTEQSITLTVDALNPSQKYTLQVSAQNENGWSEPSDKFEIHIGSYTKKCSCVKQPHTFTDQNSMECT